MSATTKLLESLGTRGYTHAVVAFLDDQGYPLSVATSFTVNAESGAVFLDPVAGQTVEPPLGREVNVATLVESARRRGEIAIGYRLLREARDKEKAYGVATNPPKSRRVTFAAGDSVIVLAES